MLKADDRKSCSDNFPAAKWCEDIDDLIVSKTIPVSLNNQIYAHPKIDDNEKNQTVLILLEISR